MAVKQLDVALVGVGAFGRRLLRYMAPLVEAGRLNLVAACDSNIEAYRDALKETPYSAVTSYKDYDAFLHSCHGLDAVIIATPLHLHADMAIKALNTGYNVLLEKPPALTVQDFKSMQDAQRQCGKICAVGFQHTSTPSFLVLQEDILKGKIGKIKRVTGCGRWKRTQEYFRRAPWVGKLLLNGRYVLDGTINNPFAHLLMNCLILSGLQENRPVLPSWVEAELYRANDIESEDNSCLRGKMDNGVELFFCASICGERDATPFITVEGDEGTAYWDYEDRLEYRNKTGQLREALQVSGDNRYAHLLNFADFLTGRADRLACPLDVTERFVLTANLAFESAGRPVKIDGEHRDWRDENGRSTDTLSRPGDFVMVKHIDEIIKRAAAEKKLYSELGIAWAKAGKKCHASGYKEFNLFK